MHTQVCRPLLNKYKILSDVVRIKKYDAGALYTIKINVVM